MTLYAKIDCAFPRDPKALAVSPTARMLYIQAILYCRENLTDGYIDRRLLGLVAVDIARPARHMQSLVGSGLVLELVSGWQIPGHAWAKWNPTRDDVETIRAIKKDAGEQGNHERWHQERYDPKCRICIADRSQRATAKGIAPVSPEPEPEPEPSSQSQPLSPLPVNSGPGPTDPDEREKFSNVLRAVFNGDDDPHAQLRTERKARAQAELDGDTW